MTFYDIHSFQDLIVFPLFWILFSILVHNYSIKIEHNKKIRGYIRLAFQLKMLFYTTNTFVFWYFYGSLLDTGGYYMGVKGIANVLAQNSELSILDVYLNPENFTKYSGLEIVKLGTDVTAAIPNLTLPLYYLANGSFLGTGTLLNFLSFISACQLYRTFKLEFPQYALQSVVATLLLPSVVIWSSGIYKDTYSFIGVCLLIQATHQIVFKKDYTFKHIIAVLLSIILIFITKPYILIVLPFLLVGIIRKLAKRLSPGLKNIFYILAFISAFIMIKVTLNALGESTLGSSQFADTEKVKEIAEGLNNYYQDESARGGSHYSIGIMDFSFTGLLRLFPNAVIVTFFRPFLWEIKSIIYIPNIIESFILLFLTLKLLYKQKLDFFKSIFKNNFLTFCFLFSIFFAFIVGVTSFNFGTLTRYKIPCMPFFAFTIFVLYAKNKENLNKTTIIQPKSLEIIK